MVCRNLAKFVRLNGYSCDKLDTIITSSCFEATILHPHNTRANATTASRGAMAFLSYHAKLLNNNKNRYFVVSRDRCRGAGVYPQMTCRSTTPQQSTQSFTIPYDNTNNPVCLLPRVKRITRPRSEEEEDVCEQWGRRCNPTRTDR